MSLPYRVTLQGFSAFERSALASYFRLAANRSPAYEQVDTASEAHFIVVDADDADAVRGVLAGGRAADTVFVGALAPQGARLAPCAVICEGARVQTGTATR